MLIVNGKMLNLSEPTTEQEKKVAEGIKQLVKDYGLESGKTVSIVYPKEYIKPNKFNPSRPHQPASLNISFRDVLRTVKGTEDWRWAEREDNAKGNIGKVYSPISKIFNGSWQLGAKDADLLYFLINISSRMEGGKNVAEGKRPYMTIENKVKDAEVFGEKAVESAYITTKLFSEMDEAQVRAFAKSIGILSHEYEDLAILRKTSHSLVSADKTGYGKLKEFLESKKKDTDADQELVKEAMTLVFKALQSEAIELNSKKEYVYLKGELAGKAIFAVGNKADKEKALAVFLSKNKPEFDAISALCE